MSMTLNERNPNTDFIPVSTQAVSSGLSAGVVLPGLYFRKHSRIKNVYYIDQVGIATSASNYLAVTLQDNSSSPVAYAAINTSGVAAVVNTPLAMPLSTPVGDTVNNPEADVPAGTQLNIKLLGHGSGVPTMAGVLVEWYPL